MGKRATMLGNRHYPSMVDLDPVPNPIRLGVVGLGRRSRNVTAAAVTYEEYRLVAVCDRQPAIVGKVTSELEHEKGLKIAGYTDFEEMLKNEQLDAVAVLIDPDQQVPLICRALESGLHAMAEVPLCYSLDHCWQLVTTAERTGKIFLLMEQARYGGIHRAWRNIVQCGVIGKPLFVEGEYFHYLPVMFFQDHLGRYLTPEQARTAPNTRHTWRYIQPPIGYLPHELSPLLFVLDDRVTRVVGMSNQKQDPVYSEVKYSSTQAALMHTEKDAVLRMAVGFGVPHMPRGVPGVCHWYHIKGTMGTLESSRAPGETAKLWVENWHLPEPLHIPWTYDRNDAPPEAKESGHGGLDYYVFAHFADAVLYGRPLDMDVYRAVETAAPAILAARSIEEGNQPFDVPDFRPGPNRQPGQMPGIVS
jgi:predicted dehydrogenase